MKKRKRRGDHRVEKRQKIIENVSGHPTKPLLLQYYPEVLTLRQYLVSRLARSSKKRQRKLLQYGIDRDRNVHTVADSSVVKLLDTTIVGTFKHSEINNVESIEKDITIFTQQLSGSTATITPTQGAFKQSEVGYGTSLLAFSTSYRISLFAILNNAN